MDEPLRAHIRRARGKFIAMAVTYSLGVFNDNFFKQAAMLMAIAAGKSYLQGHAAVIFALPYLVCAPYAGWMADRFSKRRVVIGAKFLELAAMLCGAIGIVSGNWALVLAMVGLMGLQSAIFSPSLNGSIPELYPASYVTTANAYLKVAVTGAILLGVASAGFALANKGVCFSDIPTGRAIVAAVALAVSSLGVLGSFGVPHRPAAAPRASFPLAGPFDVFRELLKMRRDLLLWVTVMANAFVWFAGSVVVLLVNQMGLKQLGLGESWTSTLVVAELVGLATGGLLSSRLSKGERWHRVLAPAALAMGVMMCLLGAVPILPHLVQVPACFVLLASAGMAGGIYLVPCEAFIQVRPSPGKRGTVIAASNFAVFTGILLSGPVANVLISLMLPTLGFAVLGCLGLFVGISLLIDLPKGSRS